MDNSQMPASPFYEIQRTDNGQVTQWENHFGLTKLEAFTMAAMQGLCANGALAVFANKECSYISVYQISTIAIEIAKETLSELSKRQSDV